MSLIDILNEQLNKAGLLKDKAGNIFFQLSEDYMKKSTMNWYYKWVLPG